MSSGPASVVCHAEPVITAALTVLLMMWSSQALQRYLLNPASGSQVTLITSDADFKPEIHHAQVSPFARLVEGEKGAS